MTESIILSHYFEFKLVQGLTTSVEIDGNLFDLGMDISDDEWHNIVFTIKDDDSFEIYIDESTAPIEGSVNGLSGGGNQGLVVGGGSVSLFGLRIVGQAISISEYKINYLNKDIKENNGNVFYEVV